MSPANAREFFTNFIAIVSLDPANIDDMIVNTLNQTQTEPLTDNFSFLGYSTLSFTRNIGFNCF